MSVVVEPSDTVPGIALDAEEIHRRGGEPAGEADYELFKCPFCAAVHLLDVEEHELYDDPANLQRRRPLNLVLPLTSCGACGGMMPTSIPPRGVAFPAENQVTSAELASSGWAWLTA